MHVFTNNNGRFCCQSTEYHYLQTFLEKSKNEAREIKMGNLIDDDLEKSSSNESDNEANNDSNDDEKDNDESNE